MRRIIILTLVGICLASCAGLPAQSRAPAWILQTPRPDATTTWFVGSSAAADPAKAEEDAYNRLLADIMRYMGVSVSVESAATAKASLDSYKADVLQTVRSSAAGRVSGLSIKDRYVVTDKKAGSTTVYILAAYLTADLEREKARIEAVFREKVDAVSRPEAEGAALAAQNRLYEAVRRFVDAAVAASGSDIDNAGIKLERNLKSAREALSRIRLVAAGPAPAGSLGQSFPAPFRARVQAGEGSAAAAVPGAAILVSYARKQGSRTVQRAESAMSGPDGSVSFTPPAPDFVGSATCTFRLDFQATIDLVDGLPPTGPLAPGQPAAALREALVTELRNVVLEMPYQVVSAARTIPTAVAIVDIDEGGAPAGGATQGGLLETLARERYAAMPSGLDPSLLATGSDEAVISAARAALAGKAQRLVLGRARVVSARKDGGMWIAEASAAVTAYDLASGAILWTGQKPATGLGADEAAARKAALRELGLNALGRELLAGLP